MTIAERKTGEALQLLSQFQTFVGQPGDLVTKARVFDEIVAKALLMIRAKVINIVVDYNSNMETLLVEMRKLMASLHPASLQSEALDSSELLEIPAAKILHDLSTPTKATRTMTGSPNHPESPSLDAQTRHTNGQLPATSLPEVVTRILLTGLTKHLVFPTGC